MAVSRRICSVCNVRPSAPKRTVCMSCKMAAFRKGPGKYYWIKSQYNVDGQWYEDTLKAQGDRCAICKTDDPGSKRWHVDHDHACCAQRGRSCGRCVRGLLCARCNLALGGFLDSPTVLANAINYLEAAVINNG